MQTKAIAVPRDVIFDENSTVDLSSLKISEVEIPLVKDEGHLKDSTVVRGENAPSGDKSSFPAELSSGDAENLLVKNRIEKPLQPSTDSDPMKDQHPSSTGRPKRIRRPPGTWRKSFLAAEPDSCSMTMTTSTANSYEEAATGPGAKGLKSGMDCELSALQRHTTRKLVRRSEESNFLSNK